MKKAELARSCHMIGVSAASPFIGRVLCVYWRFSTSYSASAAAASPFCSV